MSCRVEFVKWVSLRSGRGGIRRRKLVLARFADAYGQTRHLPEAQARALARSMARELKLGARVMEGSVEVARFLWIPSRREVVEARPGAATWRPRP
jgi:hypothetical protein